MLMCLEVKSDYQKSKFRARRRIKGVWDFKIPLKMFLGPSRGTDACFPGKF